MLLTNMHALEQEGWERVVADVTSSSQSQSQSEQVHFQAMLQRVNKAFHELVVFAPCHWTMVEIAGTFREG